MSVRTLRTAAPRVVEVGDCLLGAFPQSPASSAPPPRPHRGRVALARDDAGVDARRTAPTALSQSPIIYS